MHSRRRSPVSAGRRVLQYESDSDEEDPGPTQVASERPALTQAQKEMNANLSQLADLGTGRRDQVTAVDKGRQDRVNLGALLRDRDCNQPGTEAADLAAEYRPQLVGWANFGNTTTNDGTYEELPDIARGQSHRQSVADSLLNEGITSLEDTYGDPRRRQGVPPPMMTLGGGAFASIRGGRGGAHVGGRARPVAISSNPNGRPLDPAIVDGEKDSKYARGGLQSRARPKANVRFDSNVVRVTPMAAKGGRLASTSRGASKAVQDRPWPPAALQHLTSKLDDSAGFMAAAIASLPKQLKPPVATKAAPEKEEPKKEPKLKVNQSLATGIVAPSQSEPAAPLKEVPIITIGAQQTGVKHVSREEFRAPSTSPSSLTEGNPSPEILQSPFADSREQVPLIGLGISGLPTKPSVQVPTMIEVEIEILRKFILDRDTEALVKCLTPLLNTAPAAAIVIPATVQTPQDLRSPYEVSSVKIESLANLKKPCQNPFGPRETVAEVNAFVQPLPSKPQPEPSSKSVEFIPETLPPKPVYKPAPTLGGIPPTRLPQKPQSKPAPAQPFSSVKSKGLFESKWATASSFGQPAAKTSALQPKSANGNPASSRKTIETVIIGDLKNVSRLTEEEARRHKATQATFSARPAVIKRIQPGDGFKALLKEVEGINLKSQSQSKPATEVAPEVNNVYAALNTASALGAQFGTYRAKMDGNESDDSEL